MLANIYRYKFDVELYPDKNNPAHANVQIYDASWLGHDGEVLREFSYGEKKLLTNQLNKNIALETTMLNDNRPTLTKEMTGKLKDLGVETSAQRFDLFNKGGAQSNSFTLDGERFETDNSFKVGLENGRIKVHDGGECTREGFYNGLKNGHTEVFTPGSLNEVKFNDRECFARCR